MLLHQFLVHLFAFFTFTMGHFELAQEQHFRITTEGR